MSFMPINLLFAVSRRGGAEPALSD